MGNGIEKINEVIEYIEKNIQEEITCSELAKIALLSEYEFRRIFSFFVGVPVGEYIRKRRLSFAAGELKAGKGNVTEIGLRYGYDSASSFTRAFKETFGVSPQEAKDSSVKLQMFTKPRFEFSIRGGTAMEYTEKNLSAFFIQGVCGESCLSDTCCCESVWKGYEESEFAKENAVVYAAYLNGEEHVVCYIGDKVKTPNAKGETLAIGAGKWVCFDVSSNATEREINDLYERIVFSFLPSGIYEKDEGRPNVEVFAENGDFEIMIPVRVRE